MFHTAKSRCDSLKYIFMPFGKNYIITNAIATCDHVPNRRLFLLLDTHSDGCASHRYNITVNYIHSSNGILIENVRDIVSSLRHSLCPAKLCKFTNLCAFSKWDGYRWMHCLIVLYRLAKTSKSFQLPNSTIYNSVLWKPSKLLRSVVPWNDLILSQRNIVDKILL